jgi:hypothetical protein
MTMRSTFRLVIATLVIASGLALVTTVAGPVAPAGALPGSFTVDPVSPRNFTVPAYVRQIQVMARGGAGQDGLGSAGAGSGGRGGVAGVVNTTLQVTPGDVLRLAAGGSGWHPEWAVPELAGGAGGPGESDGADGGHGGSASGVWVDGDLKVVAGGGGGGGGEGDNPFTTDTGGPGGNGSGTPGTAGDGPGAGAGGNGAVTGRSDGVGGGGGTANDGTVAGGGGGGGGGWLPSLHAGGGVGGDAGGVGGGGGGGAAGGSSWAADASATTSIAPVQAEGQIVLSWAPRPNVSLTVSPNPALQGSNVRFTIGVGVPLAGAPVATGWVQLEELDITTMQVKLLSRGPIWEGSTWFETNDLALGQNFFRAVYQGDSYYESASTGWYNEMVVAPHAALSADVSSLDFGTQQAYTANEKTFTVTNTGNVAITPSGVRSSNPAFGVNGWTCGTALQPGASCEVRVSYGSTTEQTDTGTVNVHDANGTGVTVDVTGRSVMPHLLVSPARLDFATVTIGRTAKRTVTITNESEAPLALNPAMAAGNRAFTFSSTCTAPIRPNASCSITYTYAPTAATKQSGYTVIGDVTGIVQIVITYSGTGRVPAPAVTRISPASGTAAGGTRVTITGSNLSGVTAVRFGTKAARSFSCTSSTTCTAVGPAGTRGTTVDLRVVTPSGTSPVVTADHFRYTA